MHRLRLLLASLLTLVLATATATSPDAARAAGWVWPVSGDVITTYRNGPDPYASGQHRGIDITAPVGAPVVAAASGQVRFAGTAGSSGLTVSVRTDDGYDTSYLHLSTLAVRAGARVAAGARIGAVGTGGTRSADAPHLHFGVRTAGSRHDYRDPLTLLPPKARPAPSQPPASPAPGPPPAAGPPANAPASAAPAAPVHAPAAAAPGKAPAARAPADAPAARAPAHTPAGRAPAHAPVRPATGPARPVTAPPRPVTARAPASGPGPQPASGRIAARAAAEARRAVAPRADHAPAAEPMGGTQPATGLPPVAKRTASTRDPATAALDIGWVLACAGLLLAAGVLGLAGDGRRSTRHRGRVASAVHAVLRHDAHLLRQR